MNHVMLIVIIYLYALFCAQCTSTDLVYYNQNTHQLLHSPPTSDPSDYIDHCRELRWIKDDTTHVISNGTHTTIKLTTTNPQHVIPNLTNVALVLNYQQDNVKIHFQISKTITPRQIQWLHKRTNLSLFFVSFVNFLYR
eukprot:652760_1